MVNCSGLFVAPIAHNPAGKATSVRESNLDYKCHKMEAGAVFERLST